MKMWSSQWAEPTPRWVWCHWHPHDLIKGCTFQHSLKSGACGWRGGRTFLISSFFFFFVRGWEFWALKEFLQRFGAFWFVPRGSSASPPSSAMLWLAVWIQTWPVCFLLPLCPPLTLPFISPPFFLCICAFFFKFFFLYVHLQLRHMIGWCCTEKPACLHLLLWCVLYFFFLTIYLKRRSSVWVEVSLCKSAFSRDRLLPLSPPTPRVSTKAAVSSDSLPRPTCCCCPVSVVTSTINCVPPCSRWLLSLFLWIQYNLEFMVCFPQLSWSFMLSPLCRYEAGVGNLQVFCASPAKFYLMADGARWICW